MIKGKPTLTFGDSQRIAASQMREQDSRRARRNGSEQTTNAGFASYLPARAKNGAPQAAQTQKAPQQAKAAPAMQAAPAGQAGYDYYSNEMLLPLKSTAQQTRVAAELAPARARSSSPADGKSSGKTPTNAPAARSGSSPSMAEARARELTVARNAGKEKGPLENKANPPASVVEVPVESNHKGQRISNRPITGRAGIGMEDTRPPEKRPPARASRQSVKTASQNLTDSQIRQYARQGNGTLDKGNSLDGYSLHNPGFGLETPPSKQRQAVKAETLGKVLENASTPVAAAPPVTKSDPLDSLSATHVEAALAARRRSYFSQQDEDAMMAIRSRSHQRREKQNDAAEAAVAARLGINPGTGYTRGGGLQNDAAEAAIAARLGINPGNRRGRMNANQAESTTEAARTAAIAARLGINPGNGYGKNTNLTEPFESKRPLSASLKNMALDADKPIGSLAAKFESGAEGIAAIGYDRHGGTSYGKYQLSSRAGTMKNFISYLQEKAPHMAKKLEAAGPANTGGRRGKMPEAWRSIASSEPERFENLQNDFIKSSHFEPAMQAIAVNTGVAFERMPSALQEVLFSTAVQHGVSGATRIISNAVMRVGTGRLQNQNGMPENFKNAGRDLIKQIYAIRAGQFVSSTSMVQSSVRNRLSREMNEALNMMA